MIMDVIITSTCRNTIKRTIRSFLNNVRYSAGFRFLVNIDVKKGNERNLDSILQFLGKLNIEDITINRNPKSWISGHTEAINILYGKIHSDYYFNLEDDWVFRSKVDLDPIVSMMEQNSVIHHVRFNKHRVKEMAWLYHLNAKDKVYKRNKNMIFGDIRSVQTYVWSFNPSISRTAVAKRIIPVPIELRAEKYFCRMIDEMYDSPVTYILGQVGDKAIVKDIGRPVSTRLRRRINKMARQMMPMIKRTDENYHDAKGK